MGFGQVAWGAGAIRWPGGVGRSCGGGQSWVGWARFQVDPAILEDFLESFRCGREVLGPSQLGASGPYASLRP